MMIKTLVEYLEVKAKWIDVVQSQVLMRYLAQRSSVRCQWFTDCMNLNGRREELAAELLWFERNAIRAYQFNGEVMTAICDILSPSVKFEVKQLYIGGKNERLQLQRHTAHSLAKYLDESKIVEAVMVWQMQGETNWQDDKEKRKCRGAYQGRAVQ